MVSDSAGSARARCFARDTRPAYVGRVSRSGPAVITAIALILVLGLQARALAHDIPNDVIVQAFLKPEGQRLRFLVRVPLVAMRDVVIPQKGSGFIDVARAEDALREAATVWIAREVALYE